MKLEQLQTNATVQGIILDALALTDANASRLQAKPVIASTQPISPLSFDINVSLLN